MRPHTPVLLCVGALSAPVLAVSDASGVYEVREPFGHRGSGPCAYAHVVALGIRLDEMPHGIAQTDGARAQRLGVGLPRAPLERGDLGPGKPFSASSAHLSTSSSVISVPFSAMYLRPVIGSSLSRRGIPWSDCSHE